ncbi:SufE family protein [Marinomonas sp. 2405UD68-3]|uniref:SufE family protein n=1 Tax=Marinomonas sp. 2405UD68-3 TaxID=3391835 RepID=UPI0039C8DDFC
MSSFSHQRIKEQLQACRSKEDTFKTLVTLSKTLSRLSAEEKTNNNQVKGCESAVWLIIDNETNVPQFRADSDAKLMRGVLVAILSILEGKTITEIQTMDLKAKLAEFNLSSYLTTSRTNGVLSILDKIAQK